MKRNLLWTASLAAALFWMAAPTCAIEIRVKTEKTAYYPGETLNVLVTAINPQTNAVTLKFNTSQQAAYSIDSYSPNGGFAEVITYATIPAQGSNTWSLNHGWAYRLGVGSHEAAGQVIGYGSAGPVQFTVIPAPVPQGNFLIDFDRITGTQAPVSDVLAYEACGVHFRMIDGRTFGLQTTQTNAWLAAKVCTYPTGFNLAADFDIPVYGATVNVTAGTAISITMLARDAQSNVLASVTSAPIPQAGQFSGPLTLRTTQPIATLEWWPSDPRSLVGIDNLNVETSPVQPNPVLLSCERVPAGLRVSWPADVTHQGLEITTNYLQGFWETLAASLGTNSVILPATGQSSFMRLRIR